MGSRPINEITTQELLAVLRRIEDRTVDIAHRAKQTVGQVYKYAIAVGMAERDMSADLTGALKVRNKKHHAAFLSSCESPEIDIVICLQKI